MSELILTLLRYLLGEGCYHVFIGLFKDLPIKERTLILPSEKKAIAMEITHMIQMTGQVKNKMDGTESAIAWKDVAKELELHGLKMHPDEIRKRYNKIVERNKGWITDKKYEWLWWKIQIARSALVEDILEQYKIKNKYREKS